MNARHRWDGGRHRRPSRSPGAVMRWFARGAAVVAIAAFYTTLGALAPVEATP